MKRAAIIIETRIRRFLAQRLAMRRREAVVIIRK